jgi:hypothetical protein
MSAFQSMRTRCLSKSWPSFFVRSGKFASAFVEIDRMELAPSKGVLERHGSAEQVGMQLRNAFLKLGMMQDGPGAPKGNNNARAENRTKSPISAAKSKLQQLAHQELKARAALPKFEPVPPPKVVTLQSTTKLIDGKLTTSVKRAASAENHKHIEILRAATYEPKSDTKAYLDHSKPKRSHHKKIVGATNDAAMLPATKKATHHAIIPAKRSHHKKKVA